MNETEKLFHYEQWFKHIVYVVMAVVILIFLTQVSNAYGVVMDYGECANFTNLENETILVCAPDFPLINQVINLSYGQNYTNTPYNLTVLAPLACTNQTTIINASCPALREIEWLIAPNETRVAENVSKITIRGTGTCTETIVNNNSCINYSCPTLYAQNYNLMNGQSVVLEYYRQANVSCQACPIFEYPNLTSYCPQCPTCPTCPACPAYTPTVCPTINASDAALSFIGEGNCTVKISDMKGQMVCIDDRQKYCLPACEEIRQQLNNTQGILAQTQQDKAKSDMALNYASQGGEFYEKVAYAILLVVGAVFVKAYLDRKKARENKGAG